MPADLNAPVFVENPYGLGGTQIIITAAAANIGTAVPLFLGDVDPNAWYVVTIEVSNLNAASKVLAIQWGSTDTKDTVAVTVPGQVNTVAIDQRRIRGGLLISGWEGTVHDGALRCHVQIEKYIEPRMPKAA